MCAFPSTAAMDTARQRAHSRGLLSLSTSAKWSSYSLCSHLNKTFFSKVVQQDQWLTPVWDDYLFCCESIEMLESPSTMKLSYVKWGSCVSSGLDRQNCMDWHCWLFISQENQLPHRYKIGSSSLSSSLDLFCGCASPAFQTNFSTL